MKSKIWDKIFKQQKELSIPEITMKESSVKYCENCRADRRFANYEFKKGDSITKYILCEYCGKGK